MKDHGSKPSSNIYRNIKKKDFWEEIKLAWKISEMLG